jgi:hypothetical protein
VGIEAKPRAVDDEEGQPLAKWAQLVEKRVSPLGLELDLVVLEQREGPRMWAAQLLELLLAGDRVRVTVRLAVNRHHALE